MSNTGFAFCDIVPLAVFSFHSQVSNTMCLQECWWPLAVFRFHSQVSNTFKEYKAGASNAIFSLSL